MTIPSSFRFPFYAYCVAALFAFVAAAGGFATTAHAAEVDEAHTVDMLFVYTPSVLANLAGEDGVKAHINGIVADANGAFENSGINGKLRVAGTRLVDYTESAVGYERDLELLTYRVGPQDPGGVMDEIHALRDEVGADTVCLLRVGAAGGKAGLGWVLSSLQGAPDMAFSVVGINLNYYTFAHELGHNLGCAHNRENADVPGLFFYSYGLHMANDEGTIMSYQGRAIQYYSNPEIRHAGSPTGIAEDKAQSADNAKTINQSIPVMSAYRAYRPGSETPVITPGSGNYSDEVNVSISCATSDATVRYTIDGSTVTESSPIYREPFVARYTTTVKARAFRAGHIPSRPAEATFTILYPNSVGPLTVDPPGGDFRDLVVVNISTPTPDATIRYTLDGGDVTENSTTYNPARGVSLTRSATLKARGYKSKHNPTAEVTYEFGVTISPLAEAPVIKLQGLRTGETGISSVSIPGAADHIYTCTDTGLTPGTSYRYSLVVRRPDGTASTLSEISVLTPLSLPAPLPTVPTGVLTVSAIAPTSIVFAWAQPIGIGVTYELRREGIATPIGQFRDALSYQGPLTVSLESPIAGAEIYYTTTDSEVIKEQAVRYTAPFAVPHNLTVRARVYHPEYRASLERYTVVLVDPIPVETPVLVPGGGAYANGVKVSLKTATPEAVLRYTTDGTDVTEDSTIYTAEFPVEVDTTVKVRGYRIDFLPSSQSVADFVIRGKASVAADYAQGIATGSAHSLFLTASGELRAMGANGYGQLGDGSNDTRESPVSVATNVSTVDAARDHTLFVTADYKLWAMGRNDYGQLGDGSRINRYTPVEVASDVLLIAAGGYHSLFTDADGTLWAMGRNNYGQLGDGTAADHLRPVAVADYALFVSAGAFHSMFVTSDGSLWVMGRNDYGQLGDGTTTHRQKPIKIADDIVAISAGEFHSLFLDKDGKLWAMGSNEFGQLGVTLTGGATSSLVPVLVTDNVSAISAGDHHNLFLKNDGTVWAFGLNSSGQLGDGTDTNRFAPVQVAPAAVAVSAGAAHSIITLPDNSRESFGSNASGQLGDGTTTDRNNPEPVLPDIAAPSPSVNPQNGQYVGSVTVSIVANVPGATLYYTTDGTDVSELSTVYTGPFTLTSTTTLKVRSGLPGYSLSSQVVRNYEILPALPSVAPEILVQPNSQLSSLGKTVTFSVVATGTPAPTYQWRLNGTAISGANAPNYSILTTTSAHSGIYTVVVANATGTVTSDAAELIVQTPPAITVQPPLTLPVLIGQPATLSVVATGVPAPAYQWRRDGNAIAGATSATYVIPAVTQSHIGQYDVVVSNGAGSLASRKTLLTVGVLDGAPVITHQPEPYTSIWKGDSVTFTVGAISATDVTYQWNRNGKPIKKATQETYTVKNATTSQAGEYTVTVKNTVGATVSAVAQLVVETPVKPKISVQPAKTVDAALGTSLTLNVTATGNPPPTYQWLLNGQPIAGATSAAYTISSVAATDVGVYTVVVTSGAVSVTSRATTLTAAVPPQITTEPQGVVYALASKGAKLTVKVATAKTKPTYQWLLNGAPVDGATKDTFTAKVSGTYSVRVSNEIGSNVGQIAQVRIITPPKIATFTVSPVGAVVAGEPVTFAVTLKDGTGTPPLVYTWRLNGSPIAGAPNAPVYTGIATAGKYSVVVTNGGGQAIGKATSKTLTLKTLAAPQITRQPVSLELQAGQSAKLTVVATGTAKLTYQWYKNGVAIANATASTLSFAKVSVADVAFYTVEVDNPAHRPVRSFAAGIRVGNVYPIAAAAAAASARAAGAPSAAASASQPAGALPAAPDVADFQSIVLTGLGEAVDAGTFNYENRLQIISAQALVNGTYTYVRTGASAKLEYVTSQAGEHSLRGERGILRLEFITPTTGIYTLTADYDDTADGTGAVATGAFTSSGVFVLEK